jgi:hypothetical protein
MATLAFAVAPWSFVDGDKPIEAMVSGPLIATNYTTLLGAALRGVGLVRAARARLANVWHLERSQGLLLAPRGHGRVRGSPRTAVFGTPAAWRSALMGAVRPHSR